MSTTPHILIVGLDSKLPAEIDAALPGSGAERPIVHHVSDFRLGIEAARSRRPQLLLVEMTGDLAQLTNFAQEIAASSPHTVVAALFHPSVFGHERSESAVLIEALRSGVRDFLRRPISRHDLEQLLTRLAERQAAEAAHGKIVAVVSNKGGVGKSTMSVNIACGLAQQHPDRVLLVDLSLQVGLCASMLDVKPEASLVNAARERGRLDETLVRELATPHSSGVHLLAAPMNPVEGGEIDDETVTRVLMLARRAYDFVIVDTFPMVDRIVMAVLDVADRVYIVLENVVPTLLSGVKLIELLDGLGCDRSRQRVVLNRYMHAAGSLKAAEVAQQLGRDVDHVVPFDRKVIAAANMGVPFILNAGRFSRVGRAARRLVREIDQWQEPATNGHAAPRNGSA